MSNLPNLTLRINISAPRLLGPLAPLGAEVERHGSIDLRLLPDGRMDRFLAAVKTAAEARVFEAVQENVVGEQHPAAEQVSLLGERLRTAEDELKAARGELSKSAMLARTAIVSGADPDKAEAAHRSANDRVADLERRIDTLQRALAGAERHLAEVKRAAAADARRRLAAEAEAELDKLREQLLGAALPLVEQFLESHALAAAAGPAENHGVRQPNWIERALTPQLA